MDSKPQNRDDAGDSDTPSSYRGSLSTGVPGKGGKNVLHVLWRRRWWFVVSTAAAMVAGVLYLSKQVPVYSSAARIHVQALSALKYSGDVAGQGQSQAGTLDVQAQLIRSDTMLRSVAESEEMKRLSLLKGAPDPVAVIRSGLNVLTDSDYIYVSFESEFRDEAPQVVNAVVQRYVEQNDKQRRGTTVEVLQVLNAEKQKRLAEIDAKSKQAVEFRKQHGILSFKNDPSNMVMTKLSRLTDGLTTAQLDLSNAEAQLKEVVALKDQPQRLLDMARAEASRDTAAAPGTQPADSAATDAEIARLIAAAEVLQGEAEAAQRQVDKLRRTRTPAHKDVREAEADLAVLNDRLAKIEQQIAARRDRTSQERLRSARDAATARAHDDKLKQADQEKLLVEAFVNSVRRRVEALRAREAQLSAQVEEQKKAAFELNAVAAEYTSIEDDLRRNERLVETLDEKIRDIKVTEDTGVVRVTPLEMAKAADKPIRPDRKRVLGMSALLGLVAGVGIAFGLESLDGRLRSVEEILAVIDVPLLGLVPHIDGEAARSSRGREVQLEPESDVAEAYRTIRTAVYFMARETQVARTLLVTSPAPGDGKSTTASNLAIAMAQAGRRILLIDADFRRPVQHKAFELSKERGLSRLLAGLDPIDEAVQQTQVEGLDVLGCGPMPANPSEILNGQTFADLLDHLKGRYDCIVLDSPPVAPVTDARILAALCDETILVLRANKSTRRLTEHAREALGGVGARLLGIVVNDVPRRRDRYGYYYGYSYGYGYGYGYYGYRYGRGGKERAVVPVRATAAVAEAEQPA